MKQVAEGIAKERRVDLVIAPIWDCEGAAFLNDDAFPLATSLHTMLASYVKSRPHVRDDDEFMRNFVEPMTAFERRVLKSSAAIIANSRAIVAQVEDDYEIALDKERLHLVPHGMEDWSTLPVQDPAGLPSGMIRIVFVGRLEDRKGIDTLLGAVELLADIRSDLHFDLVGNDSLPSASGETFRVVFERKHKGSTLLDRVAFHGEVGEEELRGFYQAADVFVAPSRFESFGLIFLEAMMFAKPVIGCSAGGMPEVVSDQESGILVEPGNVDALRQAIERLADDKALRQRMGAAGRRRYLAHFTPGEMARGVLTVIDAVAARARQPLTAMVA